MSPPDRNKLVALLTDDGPAGSQRAVAAAVGEETSIEIQAAEALKSGADFSWSDERQPQALVVLQTILGDALARHRRAGMDTSGIEAVLERNADGCGGYATMVVGGYKYHILLDANGDRILGFIGT